MRTVFIFLVSFYSVCVNAQTITTVAGIPSGSTVDGIPATNANLGFVGYIAFDDSGNYYYGCDQYKVRKISSSGIVTTIAGNGILGYSGDGVPATSTSISLPGGIAINNGNVYFCDINNNRIRKVDKATGLISTVAGTGTAGFSGDGGLATAADLSQPWSLTFDNNGALIFVDNGNYRIRKINVSGIISTIAGTGINGSTGDG